MKNLLFLILILLVGLVAYNYYFGDKEEKSRSEAIISDIQDVGASVKDLVLEEKEKFDEGEYRDLLDKLKNSIDQGMESINSGIESTGADKISPRDELRDLKNKIKSLERKLKRLDKNEQDSLNAIGREIQRLADEAERLVKDLEK